MGLKNKRNVPAEMPMNPRCLTDSENEANSLASSFTPYRVERLSGQVPRT